MAKTLFKSRIRKGDQVIVISGKSRGKSGRVLKVYPKSGFALVEKVNMIKKHQKQKSATEPGGIIEKEGKIRLCKLMVLDPSERKPTRIRMKLDETGKKIRVAVRSGATIEATA